MSTELTWMIRRPDRTAGSEPSMPVGTPAPRLREEFIGRRRRATIVEYFCTLDWDDAYDHKADRRRDVAGPFE